MAGFLFSCENTDLSKLFSNTESSLFYDNSKPLSYSHLPTCYAEYDEYMYIRKTKGACIFPTALHEIKRTKIAITSCTLLLHTTPVV